MLISRKKSINFAEKSNSMNDNKTPTHEPELTVESVFDLSSIPERDLFANCIEYRDKVYTFSIVPYISIDGNYENKIDIVLTPQDVAAIRDWFYLRDKKWISFVPLEFRTHSPKVYDKLYRALIDWINTSDLDEDFCDEEVISDLEYDPSLNPLNKDCPWPVLHWPDQLFKEMDINIPNVSIWVNDKKTSPSDSGLGYPIYLEDHFMDELQHILTDLFSKQPTIDFFNIEELAEKHHNLRDVIKQRVKDMLISNFDYDESKITELTFSLYQFSIHHTVL